VSSSKRASVWIFIGIGTTVLFGMFGGVRYFNWLWKTHDDKAAQTEGVLLSFLVSGVSALITLGFIYLTRRSLEAAQDAIGLQQQSLDATERLIELERDSLKAVKDATSLEREKWSKQVSVEPRFWLSPAGKTVHNFPLIGPQHHGPVPYDAYELVIWNYSEQSFLVHSAEFVVQFLDGPKIQVVQIGKVVQPHRTLEVNVAANIFALIFKGHTASPYQLRQNLPVGQFTLISSIRYTDWQATNKKADDLFCVVQAAEKQPIYFSVFIESRINKVHG